MSGIIYLGTDSLSCFWISFASGFLIDLDHVLDYYLQEGVNFDVKRFFKVCLECRLRHLSVILHSWELLALLWFWVIWFKLGIFWISFAIGASQHMFFDLIFNSRRVKTHYFYFLSVRLMKGLDSANFCIKDNFNYALCGSCQGCIFAGTFGLLLRQASLGVNFCAPRRWRGGQAAKISVRPTKTQPCHPL